MLKLLSLFSGIGAFEKALDNLKIPYELVNFCDVDKYASASYCAIHNVSNKLNLGDITKVDISKLEKGQADLITYGFPCQDISLAGKQAGFQKDGQLTRSGLFFYASAIIGKIQPKYAIAENVKALTSKKFANEFKLVLDTLEQLGYNNYWQVLNAKDYGMPQNRERVFIVSIRKDVDDGKFEFPNPFKLNLKLKDLLESEVDEKYYLSDKTFKHYQRDFGSKGKEISTNGICSTLTAAMGNGGGNVPILQDSTNRMRKLIPKECWRLMGFDDEDFEKAKAVPMSNTQLYKQAGNSIVVNVIEEIYKRLFKGSENNE